MRRETNRHPDEEQIEKYSLGDLSEEESSRFEEHLLVCESCQNRVTESDNYVSTMQSASARVRREGRSGEKRRWLAARWVPKVAAVAAVLFLAAVGLERAARRSDNRGNAEPAFNIYLAATRGNGIEAKAPAGRVLTVQLDLAGLPPESSFRLEMVDGHGARVWQGTVMPKDSQGVASIPRMTSGLYFLRAYAPSGKLLREFGLDVGAR